MRSPSVAESVFNNRESRYLRRRIYDEYKTLIERAKLNNYTMDQIMDENLEIRNKPTYKRNHEAILPFAFDMPMKDLSKYADTVTRMTKNNLAFIGPIISTFATLTDPELARACTLTLLGNLAYIGRKSKQPIISAWALGMFKRVYEVMKPRLHLR